MHRRPLRACADGKLALGGADSGRRGRRVDHVVEEGRVLALEQAEHVGRDRCRARPQVRPRSHARPQEALEALALRPQAARHRRGVDPVQGILQDLADGAADGVRIRVELVHLDPRPQVRAHRSGPLKLVHEEGVAHHGNSTRQCLQGAVHPAVGQETLHALATQDVLLVDEGLHAPAILWQIRREVGLQVLGQSPEHSPRATVQSLC
mmetsp:Transcript_107536/g.332120  ORF Transcript_107536/g.332120 Transcript_107536/m.332120 type:complete len:208 (+) Transcript_107536:183-806(+)